MSIEVWVEESRHSRDQEANRVALGTDLSPGGTLGLSLFLPDSRGNLGKLELDSMIVDGKLSDPSEILQRELISVLRREPSRGLLEEGQKHEHDADGDQLETNGDLPLDGTAGGVHESHTVVDPETEGDTDNDDDLEETGDSTSNLGRGNLGSVGRAHWHETDEACN